MVNELSKIGEGGRNPAFFRVRPIFEWIETRKHRFS
jgi:hypothetical protein